ncbi:MAG: 50S ribosomal protein L30, partial [Candidatus Thermoplasmatota archaeon]|nr:50S ribosomal protein L30 [Candidatus Thermoplasmatota archaeon]
MLAIIRIRGSTGIKPKAQKTAELLRLHKINHLVLMPEDPVVMGMLQKAKDYLTWGEIDQETLTILLENRTLFKGRKKVEEKDLKEQTGFTTYKALAKSLIDGKVKYKDIKDVVPVLRLNPPRKAKGHVEFKWKLIWTAAVVILYFILTNIYIYGLNT